MILTTILNLIGVFIRPVGLANSARGQILQEAKCKVLIRGPLDVSEGDVLQVRRGGKQGAAVGRVRILKIRSNRITAQVLEPRSDCQRLLGAVVQAGATSGGDLGQSNASSARGAARGGAGRRGPSANRGQIYAGPFLVSSALKGVSRSTVLETYPLILTAVKVAGEVYPFAFAAGTTPQSAGHIFGLEGAFNYVTSLSDVRVSIPAPATGEEVNLDLGVQRLVYRGGVIARVHLWKGRLFLDSRAGFYSSKLTNTVKKFVNMGEGQTPPFEISPLRDLSISGFYTLFGFQFRPVQTFGTRLLAGVLLSPKYQIDNRVFDAPQGSAPLYSPVTTPRSLLLEADLNYIFGRFSLGLDVTIESFSGRALFPDQQNEGPIGELHSSYGLNFSFLL